MQLFTINQESLKNVQTLLWKDVKIIKVSNISSDVVKKKSLYNFIINDNYKKLNGLDVRWKVLWILLYQKLHIERFSDYFLHSPVCTGVSTGVHQTFLYCTGEVVRCWKMLVQVHRCAPHFTLNTGVLVWCKNFLVQAHQCMVDFFFCTGACTGAFKNWSFAPVLCTGVVHDFGAHHIPEIYIKKS